MTRPMVLYKSLSLFLYFIFVAHVKLYNSNCGYAMFSRYLEIFIVLDIAIKLKNKVHLCRNHLINLQSKSTDWFM